MRGFAPVAAAVLLLAACAPPAGEEPRAVVEAFSQALRAGDGARALELLAPDVRVYEFGGEEASRDEYAASHLKADMEFLAKAAVQVLDRHQTVDGDVAIVTTRTRVTGEFEGKPVDSLGTETMVLQRAGGRWRIVHIHWSSRPAKKP